MQCAWEQLRWCCPSIQAAKVESLEAQIKNMVLDHERELKKKDSEVSYSALFPREMS